MDPVVPATWPEDWRQRFAGDNQNALKTLNRFKSPENLYKAYDAMRAKMASGEYRRAKPDTDDEEAIKAWRTEVGVPENAEAYYENLPEGVQIEDADKPFIDRYFNAMHSRGVPVEDAQEGLKAYYEMEVEAAEQLMEQDKERRREIEDELRGEWGPEFRGNLNAMHGLFDTHGGDELKKRLFTARMSDGTPLGDDKDFLQLMVGLAKEINPAGTIVPPAGRTQMQAIEDEIAKLETEMGDTKGKNDPNAYWNSEAKQARLRELYDMQDRANR